MTYPVGVQLCDRLKLDLELETAKLELADLINLPSGQSFILKAEDKDLPEHFDLDESLLNKLEQRALTMLPDLRSKEYNLSTKSKEARDAMLSMLPDLSMNITGTWNNNNYDAHSNYLSLGMAVSYGLFEILSYYNNVEIAETRQQIEQKKLLVLSMAALAKVHISLSNYNLIRRQYHYAFKLADARKQALKEKTHGVSTASISKAELFQARLDVLKDGIYTKLLQAELYNALSQVYMSINVDMSPTDIPRSLASLTSVLKKHLAELQSSQTLFDHTKQVSENYQVNYHVSKNYESEKKSDVDSAALEIKEESISAEDDNATNTYYLSLPAQEPASTAIKKESTATDVYYLSIPDPLMEFEEDEQALEPIILFGVEEDDEQALVPIISNVENDMANIYLPAYEQKTASAAIKENTPMQLIVVEDLVDINSPVTPLSIISSYVPF